MVYAVTGWVIVEIFFYGVWCRPFADYFVVKDNNSRTFELAMNLTLWESCWQRISWLYNRAGPFDYVVRFQPVFWYPDSLYPGADTDPIENVTTEVNCPLPDQALFVLTGC
jgi:hypothetical protein